jgi:hypothetical protein
MSEEKNLWDNEDKELLATFGTLMAVDMFQTRYISEHEEYRETNPIINNYFNDEKGYSYFALTGLGAYLIADNLQPKYRKSFLRFLCAVQIGVTNNNASIGIPKYRKSFLRFLCAVQIGVTNNNASIGIGFSF